MNGSLVALEDTSFVLWLQCRTAGQVATAPTGTPTYKIYGPSGSSALLSGSFEASDHDSNTGLRKTAALSITAANGFAAGKTYTVIASAVISGSTLVFTDKFTVT